MKIIELDPDDVLLVRMDASGPEGPDITPDVEQLQKHLGGATVLIADRGIELEKLSRAELDDMVLAHLPKTPLIDSLLAEEGVRDLHWRRTIRKEIRELRERTENVTAELGEAASNFDYLVSHLGDSSLAIMAKRSARRARAVVAGIWPNTHPES